MPDSEFAQLVTVSYRDDALFLWLFSTYGEYYLWLEQESRDTFQAIARAVYDTAAEEAHAATGKDTYRPPGQTDLDRLLSEPMQNGASFHNGMCTDAEYRARQLARLTAAKKARGDPLRLEDADYRKAERVREGWLLRRSEGGHAGYIDLAMTYITGYTVARAFRDRGVEEYRFVAVIDERTTDQCRGLHGKVFRMEALKLGVNAPPIFPPPHPCRSTIRAVTAKKTVEFVQKDDTIEIREILPIKGERNLIGRTKETAVLYDENGNEIFRRYGDANSVGFTEEEAQMMRGKIFSHNHPDGSPFSPTDIYLFWKRGIKEMRAVTTRGIYSIKQPVKWSKVPESRESIQNEFQTLGKNQLTSAYKRAYSNHNRFVTEDIAMLERIIAQLLERYGVKMEFREW